jgi:hypothetical protein
MRKNLSLDPVLDARRASANPAPATDWPSERTWAVAVAVTTEGRFSCRGHATPDSCDWLRGPFPVWLRRWTLPSEGKGELSFLCRINKSMELAASGEWHHGYYTEPRGFLIKSISVYDATILRHLHPALAKCEKGKILPGSRLPPLHYCQLWAETAADHLM